MRVSFNGFDEKFLTMEASGALQTGMPVTIGANGTAKPCTDAAAPVGIVRELRGGYAAVQVSGYVKVPYTGTLSLGWQTLQGDGAGAVKAAAAGRGAIVLDVDTTAKLCGVIL